MGKRRLAVVAVSAYPNAPDSFVGGIASQVRLIEDWVGSAADAFEVTEAVVGEQGPSLALDAFRHQLHGLDPDDAVLLYVTGHGTRGRQSRQHRLLLPDNSRYRTSDLVHAAMTSGAGHVVVFVDSCHAGTLCQEIINVLEDERQDSAGREGSAALAPVSCVVVSGRPDETTRLREFATVIGRALDLLRTEQYAAAPGAGYLSPSTFCQALRAAGRQEPVPPQLAWPNALELTDDPCLALPNPGFDRAEVVTTPGSRGAALTRSQVREYWIEKASGRPAPDDPGWYFSGREALMGDVVGFLHRRGDASGAGVLVVTGVAGSGKSAVIARAVTLADPLFRVDPEFGGLTEHLPPGLVPAVGGVDAAVTARGLTAEQVAAALVSALPGRASLEQTSIAPTSLEPTSITPAGDSLSTRVTRAVRAVASTGRPVCLVIDGVDEAVDPTAVVRDVVSPLAKPGDGAGTPLARFVLGVRCAQGEDDTGTGLLGVITRVVGPVEVTTLRTDGPATGDDISAYLTAVLSTAPSPYRDDAAAARAVTQVVSAAVTPSFLDARVVGAALRAAGTRQPLDDPVWLASLREATVAQLRADLHAVAADTGRAWPQVLAVLRATAVAQGTGLPWGPVWPVVAAAVLGDRFTEADAVIEAVLRSRLGGYLTALPEGGTRVYRPNHERLTEVLRDEPDRLLPQEEP